MLIPWDMGMVLAAWYVIPSLCPWLLQVAKALFPSDAVCL